MSKRVKKIKRLSESDKKKIFRKSALRYQVFSFFQSKPKVTLKEMVAFAQTVTKTTAKGNTKEQNEKQAYWCVRDILSPRATSKRGDARGSINVPGHLYYAKKLGRQVKAGVRDPQFFAIGYRNPALKSRREEVKVAVEQVKEARAIKRAASRTKATVAV